MSKFAWVTLTTNDTYSLGALVLAHSLRRAGTAHQLAVLVTPGVSESMRGKLKDVYNVVQEVNVMDSGDAANLALLARPELGITFTKLHCWRLVQFEKCVFLDSDTLVLQNSDELFEREELSAAPDVSWPDCFNSGVFVFKPSLDTFAKITEFALKNGSFDGGDQGLLNSYFADWAHKDITKHLPFIYNVTAYASYCYLPAFKQFRSQIKILHFAGKMKPWLVQFNSANKTACTPTDYAHAADLIQLWWNIFCDNVHQKLTDNMNYYLPTMLRPLQWSYVHDCHDYHEGNGNVDDYYCDRHYHHHEHQQHHHDHHNHNEHQSADMQSHYVDYENIVFHDPWEDYYENLEKQLIIKQEQEENEKHLENFGELKVVEDHLKEDRFEEDQLKEEHFEEDHLKEDHLKEDHLEEVHFEEDHLKEDHLKEDRFKEDQFKEKVEVDNVQFFDQQFKKDEERSSENASECNRTKDQSGYDHQSNQSRLNGNYDNIHNTENSKTTTTTQTIYHVQSSINDTDCSSLKREQNQDGVQFENKQTDDVEAGLAGALSQLRLGEPRTPEQEAYEQLMRRQCWESGQIDYAGKDSFDNIWKRIAQTLDEKPVAATTPKQDDKSELLTSADIEDGKTVFDKATNATTKYKLIDGGYEMIITTPQPNGTMKTQVKTFWDPKPVNDEDLKQEAANKKLIKSRMGKEIRIDKNTTMLTRAIEGGYEEVYTTVNDDGSRSMRTKTFYDSVPTEVNDDSSNTTSTTTTSTSDKKNKKTVTRKSSVDSTDSTESRKLVQKKNVVQNVNDQQSNYQEHSTIEETRRVTQNIEITENNRTVRKNSLQEQSIKAITQTSNTSDNKDASRKKKKTKSNIPPPPPDFIENDTTTVDSKRVPGGVEYTYSTQLESGKTITTTKTVYEEEECEMTEEEIRQYKKTLKDAEKHKNVTTTKKLKSESGTKKIVPSENPGDVTTVETIKIEGGTEYHYTTVTAEGIVKKAVKTIYDPVPCKGGDDDESEEEIVEEYEEEIIEPGEKNVRTIETVKQLPKKFEGNFAEEVTITHEKKEKKVKKSMMISQ